MHLCALLQMPMRLYAESSNLNGFTAWILHEAIKFPFTHYFQLYFLKVSLWKITDLLVYLVVVGQCATTLNLRLQMTWQQWHGKVNKTDTTWQIFLIHQKLIPCATSNSYRGLQIDIGVIWTLATGYWKGVWYSVRHGSGQEGEQLLDTVSDVEKDRLLDTVSNKELDRGWTVPS